MKVILIKDVARLGRKSEIKDVPDGHAINFLIPKKFAIIATPDQVKRVSEEVKKHGEHHNHSVESFQNTCTVLKEKSLKYYAEANDQGHLFKGVNTADISACLKEEGIILSQSFIKLEHPLKSVGIHEVPLSFEKEKGVCTLEIIKK